MRRSSLTMFAIPLLVFDASGFETRSACVSHEEAVRTTVRTYFDGVAEGRPDKLRSVFHEDALLVAVDRDGSVVRMAAADWAAGLRGPLREPAHRREIASVDIHGNAASVKTILEWPAVRYVDYLSLVRVEGQWRIMNRVRDRSALPARLTGGFPASS